MAGLMSGFRCGNQQFAGHAAYAGAGRAVDASFDQEN
jgi:hypothetical protein